MRWPKPGETVEIELLDHDEQEEEAYEATAWGRVGKVTKTAVVIDSWGPTDKEADRDKLKGRNALTSVSIVKKAILDWWYLDRRTD